MREARSWDAMKNQANQFGLTMRAGFFKDHLEACAECASSQPEPASRILDAESLRQRPRQTGFRRRESEKNADLTFGRYWKPLRIGDKDYRTAVFDSDERSMTWRRSDHHLQRTPP